MQKRLKTHPILTSLEEPKVEFRFQSTTLLARKGETIASALYANGIRIFGRHHKDDAPQGLFCANGQCSQCLVTADGRPVKSCMIEVSPGMQVEPCDEIPALPPEDQVPSFRDVETREVQVLIVGAGPAGICAAEELGRAGFSVLMVDDKAEAGGKLSLQTHPFFGSIRACHAGTRGIDLTEKLAANLHDMDNVDIRLNTTAVGVYNDATIGMVAGDRYLLIQPEVLLVAAGAREKSLSFPGCDLPGIYGAGAFQTLVNRDRIRSAERLFIVGGGNVGLIAGYHALQAGIGVSGLVEALPEVGGYKVHLDKLKRLGVPVWTSHTVLRADGTESLERVTIAACDKSFQPVAGTERIFDVDTLLIAVGLSPVDELAVKARQCGLTVFSAGDASEIAEASAAIFSGRITGRRIAEHLGHPVPVPAAWRKTADVLKSKPGRAHPLKLKPSDLPIFPVIHCTQDIPCNPCTQVCPLGSIVIPDGSITSPPRFRKDCLGCGECVIICPALAIKLVTPGIRPDTAVLMLPWEFGPDVVRPGEEVVTVDTDGKPVGLGTILGFRQREDQNRRTLLLVEVPKKDQLTVAGFRIQKPETGDAVSRKKAAREEDPIVCRCERVRKSELVSAIRSGIRDLNVLKAVTRASMGGCGGRTCTELTMRVFREENVSWEEVTAGTMRPPTTEVSLGVLAGIDIERDKDKSGGPKP
jgi:NADPH-dependent 2,4-dienoyl-CoA reductase/sulfur reductase-like enzyme/Fe-S-cluster-containing hydrogenase component 2